MSDAVNHEVEAYVGELRALRLLRQEIALLRAKLERCTCGAPLEQTATDRTTSVPTEEQLELPQGRIACMDCD